MAISKKLVVPTVLANADPVVTDDREAGLTVGFRWINTTTGDRFTCIDDAAGAADWQLEGAGGGGDISVTDGTTTVDPCTAVEFTSGAVVTDAGGGLAEVAISGGSGNSPIVQAVDDIDEADHSTTSTSYAAVDATNASITITPTSISNRIRLRMQFKASASGVAAVSFTIKRGSTFITPAGSDQIKGVTTSAAEYQHDISIEIYDSPATTSAVTYELWWKVSSGTGYINYIPTSGYASPLVMVAEEISAGASSTTSISTKVALFEDRKTQNTMGGTATSGSWQTRDLNTEVFDPENIATLASNKVTPIAGTYEFEASAPGWYCGPHQIRLYNVTDSSVVAVGTPEYSVAGSTTADSRSFVRGSFTTDGTKEYRLEHQVTTTKTNDGFGVPANFTTEVYSQLRLVRLVIGSSPATLENWQSTTVTIEAVTTNPTKGTVVRDNLRWRRVGDSMEIQGDYKQSAAGSSGSGAYLIKIPGGYTMDSSKITFVSGAGLYGQGIGSAEVSDESSYSRWTVPVAHDSTSIRLVDNVAGDISSTNHALGAGSIRQIGFFVTVPITEWA
jgi:hypothetical protein